MNRTRALGATANVRLLRFDHPPGEVHEDPRREEEGALAISYLESGSFSIERGRRRREFTPGDAFLTAPGVGYRYRHDRAIPDDRCLCLIFDRRFFTDHLELAPDAAAAGKGWARAAGNALAYRFARCAAAPGDRLALEARALEVAHAFLSGGETPPGRHVYRRRQLAWYSERIDAARAALERRSDPPASLADLSREVGMSAFHFCRVFRELVGEPPHRYALGVRLERAARRLAQGASVTRAALDGGFHNLGYFSRAFRKRYGVPPSRFGGRA
jgi:AraC-like DNA-binding protein